MGKTSNLSLLHQQVLSWKQNMLDLESQKKKINMGSSHPFPLHHSKIILLANISQTNIPGHLFLLLQCNSCPSLIHFAHLLIMDCTVLSKFALSNLTCPLSTIDQVHSF